MNESLDTLNQDNILLYIKALGKNVLRKNKNALLKMWNDLKNFLKTSMNDPG